MISLHLRLASYHWQAYLLKQYGINAGIDTNIKVIERPYRAKNPAAKAAIKDLGEFCHAIPTDITEAQWDQRVPASQQVWEV